VTPQCAIGKEFDGDVSTISLAGSLGLTFAAPERRVILPQRKDIPMDNDLDQAKGRIKQAAGDLTDNDDLKREGKADEAGGKVKEFLEDAKNKAEDLVDKVKHKFDGDKNT